MLSYSPDMRDLVAGLLESRDAQAHDTDTAVDEFGEPLSLLLGYGDLGARIARQGWDSRYPHRRYSEAHTYGVQRLDDLPTAATDADFIILTGSTDCHRLGESIGDTLPEETTSIAIPVPVDDTGPHEVAAVDATIPCTHALVQELATDLLTILTARIRITPPPQLYQELQTAGLLQGFRGRENHVESGRSARDFAETLVANTLETPVYTDDRTHTGACVSFLQAGTDLTLRDAEAVRDEITARVGSGGGPELFAAAATEDVENESRLTLLRV
jgi:hypothetical protein